MPTPPAPLFDPVAAVAHLRASDARLAAVIDRAGPYAPNRTRAKSLFEALLRAIVYQQLHGKAAETILGRVEAVLKAQGKAQGKKLTPHAATALATDEALRGAGLSRNKLLALRDLHAKCLDGTVPTPREAAALDDEALIARLTQVRGIGRGRSRCS